MDRKLTFYGEHAYAASCMDKTTCSIIYKQDLVWVCSQIVFRGISREYQFWCRDLFENDKKWKGNRSLDHIILTGLQYSGKQSHDWVLEQRLLTSRKDSQCHVSQDWAALLRMQESNKKKAQAQESIQCNLQLSLLLQINSGNRTKPGIGVWGAQVCHCLLIALWYSHGDHLQWPFAELLFLKNMSAAVFSMLDLWFPCDQVLPCPWACSMFFCACTRALHVEANC